MKSIIARFTELKNNVDETNEDMENVDLNKVDKALKSVGVQLKDSTGSFRNLDEVFLELSQKWDTLTRNQQRYISTIAAGSRQQSRFIALMQDYGRTVELVNIAQNSAGRSDEQFAKYADTITYKINQIKNSWEEMRLNFLDSKTYKGILDQVNNIFNIFKNVDPAKLLINGAVFAVIGTKIIGEIIKSLKDNTQPLSMAFKNVWSQAITNNKAFNSINEWLKQRGEKAAQAYVQGFSDKFHINVNLENFENLDLNQINNSLDNYASQKRKVDLIRKENAPKIESNKEAVRRQENYVKGQAEKWKNAELQYFEKINELSKKSKNLTEEQLLVYKELVEEQGKNFSNKKLESELAKQMAKAAGQEKQELQEKIQIIQKAKNIQREELNELDALMTKRKEESTILTDSENRVKELKEAEKIKEEEILQIQRQEEAELNRISQELIEQGFDATQLEQMSEKEILALKEKLVQEKALTEEKMKQRQMALNSLGSGIQSAVTFGLTAGITTFFSTGDFEVALKAGATSALTSLVPTFINYVMVGLTNIIAPLLTAIAPLIPYAMIALVAGGVIAAVIKGIKDNIDGTTELKELQKEQKSLQEAIDKTAEKFEDIKKDRDETKTEQENLEELNKAQEEYNEKTTHTLEEQREFQETLKKYAEDYPDLIKEVNGQYEIQNRLLKDNLDTIKEQRKEQELQLAAQKVVLASQEEENARNEYEQAQLKYADALQEVQDYFNTDYYGSKSGHELDLFFNRGKTAEEVVDFLEIQYRNNQDIIGLIKELDEKTNSRLSKEIGLDIQNLQNTDEDFQKLTDAIEKNIEVFNISNLKQLALADATEEVELAFKNQTQAIKESEQTRRDSLRDAFLASDQNINSELATFLANQVDLSSYGSNIDWNDEGAVSRIANRILTQEKDLISNVEQYEDAVKAFNEAGTNLTQEEIENLRNKLKTTNEDEQKFINEAINTRQKNLDEALKDTKETDNKLIDLFGLNSDTIKPSEIEAINKTWSDFIGTVGKENQSKVSEVTQSIKTGWNLKDQNNFTELFTSGNFSNLTPANYEQVKQDWIDKAHELGELSGNSAGEAFDSAVKTYIKAGMTSVDFSDPEKLDEFLEDTKKKIDEANNEGIFELTLLDEGSEIGESQLKELQDYFSDTWQEYYDNATRTIKNVDKLSEDYENNRKQGIQDLMTTVRVYGNEIEAQDVFKNYNVKSGFDIIQRYNELINIKDKDKETQEEINKLEEDFGLILGKTTSLYQEALKQEALLQARTRDELKKKIDTAKEEYDKLKDLERNVIDATEKWEQAQEDLVKKPLEAQKEITEQIAQNEKDRIDALNDINDAIQAVNDQYTEIAEKEKELNEALYGTSNWLTKNDPLKRYTDSVERASKAIEKAKEALDEPAGADIKELMRTYGEAIHQEAVAQQALNQRNIDRQNIIAQQLASYGEEYFKTNKDGSLVSNIWALSNAQMNDQYKEDIEDLIEEYNKLQQEIIEGQDKYNKVLKELEDRRKSALKDAVSLQKDTAETLKKSYEQEVKDVKEKYDAIKEADDDYLSALQDAINKQRQLRDEQDKWDSLAEKEKRLSLIERDTSGSQQKEVIKQQNDIEKERQSLLDSSIDNILNTLKETYEEQQKEREEELEYQEKIIEDMDFMRQALEILGTMSSNEDYLAWLMETNPEFSTMTELEQQSYIDEHENDFSKYQAYEALQEISLEEYIQATKEEVDLFISEQADNLEYYLETSHQNTVDKITEEQDKAREAVDEAYEKLTELEEKVDEAYQKYDETIQKGEEDLQKAYENFNQVNKEVQRDWEDAKENYQEQMTEMKFAGFQNIGDIHDAASQASIAYYNTSQSILENLTKKGIDYIDALATAYGDAEIQDFANIARQKIYEAQQENQQVQAVPSYQITAAIYNSNIDKLNKEIESLKSEYQNASKLPGKDATFLQEQIQSNINAKQESLNKYNENLDTLRNAYFDNFKKKIPVNKEGGIVDYTGLAWVDGTPTKPEAFLSAEDTTRIGAAAQLLSNIPALNSSSITDNSYTSNIGDTNIEVHINVENVSTEMDIDNMVKRVEDDIVEMSNLIGNPILLNK